MKLVLATVAAASLSALTVSKSLSLFWPRPHPRRRHRPYRPPAPRDSQCGKLCRRG